VRIIQGERSVVIFAVALCCVQNNLDKVSDIALELPAMCSIVGGEAHVT
jgi:hypothetical protein